MFSFHKPKVYRSTQGCCICKAKSSSSRFTDSKKYENDFIECFKLESPRKGEICNACVLLVKRFKRLPPGSDRNWGHVVDARVGPGLKSMSKFKKRREEALLLEQNGGTTVTSVPKSTSQVSCFGSNGTGAGAINRTVSSASNSMAEKFGKIFKKTKKKRGVQIPTNDGSSDENSWPTSPASCYSDDIKDIKFDYELQAARKESQLKGIQRTMGVVDKIQVSEGMVTKKNRRKNMFPQKNRPQIEASFIDPEQWILINTCCGPAYEHKVMSAIMFDETLTTPCGKHGTIAANGVNNSSATTHSTKSSQPTLIGDGLVRRINNATNSIINAQIVKPLNNFPSTNGTSVVAIDIPNKYMCNTNNVGSGTALKKHQLYSRRQNQQQQPIIVQHTVKTDQHVSKPSVETTTVSNGTKPTTTTTIVLKDGTQYSAKPGNYLHKINADSCKIVKQSFDKISSSSIKIRASSDFHVKNLVKMCTEKSTKVRTLNGDKMATTQNMQQQKNCHVVAVVMPSDIAKADITANGGSPDGGSSGGVKFSDNSSDSGYEEPPTIDSLINSGHVLLQHKPTKHLVVRPPLMVNGIKVQVQPQNLLLAAKLAGVSQGTSSSELPIILQDLLR